jgi:hypothetical protein
VHKKPIDKRVVLAKGHARCSKLVRQWIRLLKKLVYAFDRGQGKGVLALAPTFIPTKRRGTPDITMAFNNVQDCLSQ